MFRNVANALYFSIYLKIFPENSQNYGENWLNERYAKNYEKIFEKVL